MRYFWCPLIALVLISIAAGFLGIGYAGFRAAKAVDSISADVETLTKSTVQTESVISALPGALEADANRLSLDILRDADNQATGLRRDVMKAVDDSLAVADARIGDGLTRVDAAVAEIKGLRTDLQPVLASVGRSTAHWENISAHIDAALPDFTDCAYTDDQGNILGGNPDCAFNRFQGTSKAVEKAAMNFDAASTDLRAAIPGALNVWQDFGKQTDGVAANLNRLTKPHWYDRVLGYGLTGLTMYRDLNPVQNLVIGISQAAIKH